LEDEFCRARDVGRGGEIVSVAAQRIYTVTINVITPTWKMSSAGHVMWAEKERMLKRTRPDEEVG
jgi:hypothetical protein